MSSHLSRGLKIRSDPGSPSRIANRRFTIELEGQDISRCVTAIRLDLKAGEIAYAEITYVVNLIDADIEEVMTELRAHDE